jgi:rRNA maturation endonuclease Nob1
MHPALNLYLIKDGAKPTVVGNVSAEILYHFNCISCERWWSIGDFKMDEKVFCVHCGEEYTVLPIKKN